MDFTKMARKVRLHEYKTKRDFINDLNLIWDNCLLYNSEPVSLSCNISEHSCFLP